MRRQSCHQIKTLPHPTSWELLLHTYYPSVLIGSVCSVRHQRVKHTYNKDVINTVIIKNYVIQIKCFGRSLSTSLFLMTTPPPLFLQVLGEKMWWSTCCRRAPMCMRAMMAASSHFTTPALSVTPRWGGLASVPQIACSSNGTHSLRPSLQLQVSQLNLTGTLAILS